MGIKTKYLFIFYIHYSLRSLTIQALTQGVKMCYFLIKLSLSLLHLKLMQEISHLQICVG